MMNAGLLLLYSSPSLGQASDGHQHGPAGRPMITAAKPKLGQIEFIDIQRGGCSA